MIAGFKKFIMQGNAIDLAVGVVIGAAFKDVVDKLVAGVINPIVALILGNNANGITGVGFDIGKQRISIGLVIDAAITFTLTAAAVYFLIVLPINALKERRAKGAEPEAEPTNEEKMVALLEQIAGK